MFEIRIMVPVADNQGVVFDPAHHAAFEAELLARFPGFTLENAPAKGGWKHPTTGVVYQDDLLVYVVAVSSIAAGANVVASARFAKNHYRQDAICIRYLGEMEIVA